MDLAELLLEEGDDGADLEDSLEAGHGRCCRLNGYQSTLFIQIEHNVTIKCHQSGCNRKSLSG